MTLGKADEKQKAETGKPGRNFCFLLFQPAAAQRRKTGAPACSRLWT
jgi:hypothetical protein